MKKIMGIVLLAVLISSTVGVSRAEANCIDYYANKKKNKTIVKFKDKLEDTWQGYTVGAGALTFVGTALGAFGGTPLAVILGGVAGFSIVAAPITAFVGAAGVEKLLDIRWERMHRLLVQAKRYSQKNGEKKPGLYLYRFYKKIRKKNYEFAGDFPTLLEVAESITESSNSGDLCVDNKITLRDLVRDADYFIEF